MANTIARLLRRYPVVMVALLAVLALLAARFHAPVHGMWDGPI